MSSSLTRPSSTTRSRSGGGPGRCTSSASPGPAMSSRSPGRLRRRASPNARSRTGRPLRGSSIRPRNPSAPPSPGQPGQRLGLREPADRDPVRDQHRVAAHVLDQGLAGRLGHGDPGADLLQRGPQHRLGRVRSRGSAGWRCGRWPRSGRRRPSRPAATGWAWPARARAARRSRPRLTQRRTRAADTEAEREPGHRAVVGHRDRAPGGHHVGRQRRVVVGRGDHRDVVAQPDQRLGQVPDVLLHAARHVPGVRADDADPHLGTAVRAAAAAALRRWPRPPPAGRDRGRRRRRRWSMCQSCGCAAIPASKTAAICWVIAATLLLPVALVRHRDLLVERRASQHVAVEPQGDGHQGGAGLHGQRRRAGRASGPSRRRSPPRRRAPVSRGRRAGRPARRPAAAAPARRTAAVAAGGRQHLHAQALPEGDEPLVTATRA